MAGERRKFPPLSYPCGAEFAMILSTPTDLATQWYGGISFSYHHKAGIVSLLLPRVKNTPQSTENIVHFFVVRNASFVWKDAITRQQENITIPFPRPLLTHILFYVSRAGLARLHHPSPCDLKISTILASSGSAAASTAPPKPSPSPTNTLPSTHTWRAF